jgi:hypothetical protein
LRSTATLCLFNLDGRTLVAYMGLVQNNMLSHQSLFNILQRSDVIDSELTFEEEQQLDSKPDRLTLLSCLRTTMGITTPPVRYYKATLIRLSRPMIDQKLFDDVLSSALDILRLSATEKAKVVARLIAMQEELAKQLSDREHKRGRPS